MSEADSDRTGPYRQKAFDLRNAYKIERLQEAIKAGVTKDAIAERQQWANCVNIRFQPGKYCSQCNPCGYSDEEADISNTWSDGEESFNYSVLWEGAEHAVAETKRLQQKVAIVDHAAARIVKRQRKGKRAKRVGNLTGTWDLYNVEEYPVSRDWYESEWYRIRITEHQLDHFKDSSEGAQSLHSSNMKTNDCTVQGTIRRRLMHSSSTHSLT